MRRAVLHVLVIATLLIAPRALAGQQAGAPAEAQVERLLQRMLGTWRLNVAKSQYFVGPPAKESTIMYAPAKEKHGILYGQRRVGADGSTENQQGLAVQFLDGKEHPFTAPNLVIIRRPIDEFTAESTHFVKDTSIPPPLGLYLRSRQVFSPDGRTLTITTSSFNSEGREVVARIAVYEKVE